MFILSKDILMSEVKRRSPSEGTPTPIRALAISREAVEKRGRRFVAAKRSNQRKKTAQLLSLNQRFSALSINDEEENELISESSLKRSCLTNSPG